MFDAKSPDYFSCMGLPKIFAIDEGQLTERYYALQRQCHPDCWIQASAEQQSVARQQAAMINRAFHTLKDRLRRAEYLLSLQGQRVDEVQSWGDDDFLREQLSLREALEQVVDQDGFEALVARIAQLSTGQWQQLTSHLLAAEWQLARHPLCKLKFFAKLQQQLQQLALSYAPL